MCVCSDALRESVTRAKRQRGTRRSAIRLTLRHQGMRSSQVGVFRVLLVRAVNEVLEQEEVSRASLNDGQEPVSELELSAARIRFLGRHESREVSMLR